MKPGWLAPVPSIYIDGVQVPATLAGESDGTGVVLDDLAISWGVTELFGETEPSRLTLRISDRDGKWIGAQSLPGAEIQVKAAWLDPDGGSSRGRELVIFRGQIADATVEPEALSSFRAGNRTWNVTLTCVDRLGQLGNVLVNRPAKYGNILWEVREIVSFIQAASGLGLRFEGAPVSELWKGDDIVNESGLALTHEVYRSVGASAHYMPDTDTIKGFSNEIFRQTSGSYLRRINGQWRPETGRGRWFLGWDQTAPAITLGANRLRSTAALSSSLSQAATQVTVSDVFGESTTLPIGGARRRVGRRAIHRTIRARQSHLELARKIQEAYEISGWMPEPAPVTHYSTIFRSAGEIKAQLTPAPSGALYMITGSLWREADQDWPGIFQVRSGNIRYRKQKWEIQSNLTPFQFDWSRVQPFTYTGLAEYVTRLGNRPGALMPLVSMAESFAWGDFRSVNDITDF